MSQGAGNVTFACDDCRRKRIKCSRERPKCKSCAPFSSPCIYSKSGPIRQKKQKIPKDSSRVQPETMSAVELRLNILENKILRLESAGHAPKAGSSHAAGEDSPTSIRNSMLEHNDLVQLTDDPKGQLSFSDEGPRGLDNDNSREDCHNQLLLDPTVSDHSCCRRHESWNIYSTSGSARSKEDVVPSEREIEIPGSHTDCPPMQSPGSSVFEVEVNGRRVELVAQELRIPVQADTALGNETTQVDNAKFHADDTIHTPDASHWTAASSPTAAAEDFIVEEFRPLTTLLEQQQQQRAEPYDPSVLDAWLKKQSDSVEHSQPTPSELLKSQLWGCIDPRKVWPKEPSAEWLADKRKEIEARGGRKANFGRLLTPQVVKERKENGCGVHQNKDTFHDEESKIALTELYGLDRRILRRR